MYTIISNKFRNRTESIKLLSSRNGEIVLNRFQDVKIYAHTQGVIYYLYETKGLRTEYYIKLAELMRGENRNRWATYCYTKALHMAWYNHAETIFPKLTTYKYPEGHRDIDPYDLYKTIRLYLLEIDDRKGLRSVKEVHNNFRYCTYKEHKKALSKRGEVISKDVDAFWDKCGLSNVF